MAKNQRIIIREKLKQAVRNCENVARPLIQAESIVDSALFELGHSLTPEQKQRYEEIKQFFTSSITAMSYLQDMIETFWRNY